MNEDKRYGLYLARPEDIGETERFFLITPKWSLLYTDSEPPEPSREITELDALPAMAREWLNETIEQLRAEHLAAHQEEILRRGREFARRFEAELKAEREKLAAERVNGDG